MKKTGKMGDMEHNYLSYLISLLMKSEKVIEVISERNIKLRATKDDLPIIKAACSMKGSIIITTDEDDFINNEEVQKVLSQHNVKVLTVQKAINSL